MNSARRWFSVFGLLFLLAARPASALSLSNFQIAGIGVWSGLSNAVFVQASWTPYFGLGLKKCVSVCKVLHE